jgi:hypothetical protein
MIESDKIMITAFDDTLAALDFKNEMACKFIGPDQLKIYKKLTKFTKRDYSLLLICLE